MHQLRLISSKWEPLPNEAKFPRLDPAVMCTPLHHLVMFFAADAFQLSNPTGVESATVASLGEGTQPVFPLNSNRVRELSLASVRVPSVKSARIFARIVDQLAEEYSRTGDAVWYLANIPPLMWAVGAQPVLPAAYNWVYLPLTRPVDTSSLPVDTVSTTDPLPGEVRRAVFLVASRSCWDRRFVFASGNHPVLPPEAAVTQPFLVPSRLRWLPFLTVVRRRDFAEALVRSAADLVSRYCTGGMVPAFGTAAGRVRVGGRHRGGR